MSAAPTIDRPSPPPCYAVVAFEVRWPGRVRRWLGLPCGFAEAVAFLRSADCPAAARLVAVAWFADLSLDLCPDGRERVVSAFTFDPAGPAGGWSAWAAEPVVVCGRSADLIRRAAEPVRRETLADDDC